MSSVYGFGKYGESEYGKSYTLFELVIAIIVLIITKLLGGRK